MAREVVLVCGAPGAGKSTFARTLGLTVYDRDDPQWAGREDIFRAALAALAADPAARAAVIRTGSTRDARTRAADLCMATRAEVLLTPRGECIRRVIERGRGDVRGQIAAIERWWGTYERECAGHDEEAHLGERVADWW